jgi:transmembrane sensor
MESSVRIEEIAADWVARRDSQRWTAADQAELDEWLKETAHRIAYVRLAAGWRKAQRLQALGAGTAPGEEPEPDRWTLSPFFKEPVEAPPAPRTPSIRARWYRHALVASLLLAIVGGVAWYQWQFGSSYRTPVGGIASVPMSDGSRITLNTDSRIRIDVTEKERRVDLDQGEAFFEVAKDPRRPFVVSAGSKRVIAVGTQFSVRRVGSDIRVFVTEGKVRVEGASPPSKAPPRGMTGEVSTLPEASNMHDPPREILVAAGGIARTDDDGVLVQEKQFSRVEDYLSWRSGYLVVRETPLAEAVAEFNRYNTRRIVIEDPHLTGMRIGGNFKSTNVDAFVRLLEEAFPIAAEQKSGAIVLRGTTE